ncbi:hypothetical protein E2562_024451 [Oryza meyeriana var. granulata]|uniref:MATH domain-containing protein n=1 Tax=Oryza meyeriana var. granulata TaxID=110450 RepID=A0A6G1EYP5_9ORYZ|nr:hypothetical protein E2562_024451 [Oryza meyeriana var. granulata]
MSSSSRSVSAIVADRATGYHLLKIDGYSLIKGTPNGTALVSSQFTVGDHSWRIHYYPNGDSANSADYVSLYLSLDEKRTKDVKVQAQMLFQISYTGQVEDRPPSLASEIRAKETMEILPAGTLASVPPSNMNQHLGDLLETEKGADVVFESDTAGGVVRIEDMEAQVFKMLLRFVYTDSLPEMKKEEDVMCQHLLVAADRYNLDRLKLICEEKLCRYISVGTVTNMLALADQHHCGRLRTACFKFLGSPANLSSSCLSVMKELVLRCWCLH